VLEQEFGSLPVVDLEHVIQLCMKRYTGMIRKVETRAYVMEYLNVQQGQCYVVPFEQVTDLVGRRKVLVLDGKAYIPTTERMPLFLRMFQTRLQRELEHLAKVLPSMEEEDRLMPILYSFAKQSLAKEYSVSKDSKEVRAQDIPHMAKYFPPCMQEMYRSLQDHGHLKHQGRIQFGLFLKGIGVPLEEALIFWRKAFTMSDEEYTKKGYVYNIRYNYGQEGKRTNYTPYSCGKIIGIFAGQGDRHGCPFRYPRLIRTQQRDDLEQVLHRMGVDKDKEDILGKAKEGHYQIACTKCYEVKHQTVLVEPIDHPNRWFDLAMKQ
jgi:DNA primase large subunit